LFDLFSLLPWWDIITNATNQLLTQSPADTIAPIAAQQLTEKAGQVADQVSTNSDAITGTTIGLVGTVGTLAYKFITDRKNDLDVVSKGSVTDKMIFNEVVDNHRIMMEYFKIELEIQAIEIDNPTLTRAQISDMVYDKATKETYGMRKAKFMRGAVEEFNKYYGGVLSTGEIYNYTKNTKQILNSTLNLVKDKTGL